MTDTSKQEIKLFYCYAHEDKPIRDELEKHLSWLRRRYQLINWHDREIMPGEEWEQAIDMHLNTANLILLLISSDFMNSDYCYGKEMRRALERHRAGTCRVIPILLRPTYWEDAPFSSLQLLPTDARPITRWSDRDEAFQDVVTEISRTIKDLLISLKTKEEWIREGNALNGLKRYEEALAAYEQAIRLDPNYVHAYNGKGNALSDLKRYEEALAALTPTLPTPTRIKAMSSETSSAIRKQNKLLKKHANLTYCHMKAAEEILAFEEQLILLANCQLMHKLSMNMYA